MTFNETKRPSKGDEVFFIYKSVDEHGEGTKWQIASSSDGQEGSGFIVEEIIYAPKKDESPTSSYPECLPYYILRGVSSGLVIDHQDIFTCLDQAILERDLRSIFPQ